MNKNFSLVAAFFFINFALSITPVVAKSSPTQIVQQNNTKTEDIRTAAEKAFEEGWQLYQEGTAESLRQAIVKWEEELKLWQQLEDKSQQALTLIWIGNVYSTLGEKLQTLEHYNQALLLYREVNDRGGEATALNNIGLVYSDLGKSEQALECYNQALLLYRALKDRRGEATTLSNIGAVYSDLGKSEQALQYYSQALLLYRALKDKRGEANTLGNIGGVYSDLGKSEQALEYYNQALPLHRALKDRRGEATTLGNIGYIYSTLWQKHQALEYYNQALEIFRTAKDRRGEATTLGNIGGIYKALEKKHQALEYYNQALEIFRTAKDRKGEGIILNNIGNVYNELGNKQQALEYYNQALSLRRASGDRGGEAITLNNIGNIYDYLGEKQQALEYYNQALSILHTIDDPIGKAGILNNIGGIYHALGERQKALEYYNQALSIRLTIDDPIGKADTFNNIGAAYNDLGKKQKALEYYNQALLLYRAIENQSREAITLSNIGVVYKDLGKRQQALEYYNQALFLYREVKDKNGEAITLNNIGLVYYTLGKRQQALEYYNQTLVLFRAIENRTGEATVLNNIGGFYDDSGEKQKALEYYNQALFLHREVKDKDGEATALNNIGTAYDDLEEKQKALEYYNQALLLSREVKDKDGEAFTLSNMGIIYDDLGEKQKALEYYNQALLLHHGVGNRDEEAANFSNIALLHYDKGDLTIASEYMQKAIERIEFLRNQIFIPELQNSFYLTIEKYYDVYIKILMELHQQSPSQGYHAQALHYSERVRARQLLTQLREANVDIRQGVAPELLAQEKDLNQQLAAALENKAKLRRGSFSNTEKENLNKRINSLIAELEQVEASIRLQSPSYAAINQPSKFTLQTSEIQEQLLDDNTLLIEYYLGQEASYLWVVSQDKVSSYQLPPQEEIEQLAEEFRNDIASETKNNLEIGQKLSEMILAPALEELGNKRLLIVGDGVLQSIPFAALPTSTSNNPLIVNNEIITLPSASSLAALRQQVRGRPPASKKLAILADPVYELEEQEGAVDLSELSGMRATRDACLSLQQLPYTRTEAENILALVPEDEGFAALGYEASVATATSHQLSEYQIIHFAAHGCLNEDVPQFSGLALSVYDSEEELQDPLLRLDTIYNLTLPAELVVLSACETGLGKKLAGEGLVSLTRGFMYAGAKGVVVSFWSVNDSSTAELMSKFYQKMYQENLKPPAALREAQLEMWQSNNGNWQDPYHWAAFTLQGKW